VSLIKTINDLEHNKKYFKLQFFEPYDYQKKYYSLKGANGRVANARALISANQIGKTLGEGAEVGYHATGLYPDWWDGVRVNPNPKIVCSGKNSYRTRDLIQFELLGTPDKDDKINLGTGWIPKHLIHKIDRKPGIPGAAEKIYVKRNNGMELASILLLGYEDGPGKVMGERIDYGWLDEESPIEIWSQYVRGTIATNGFLALTATPEDGMTELIYKFMHECPDSYAMMVATWEDVNRDNPKNNGRGHLTNERIKEKLAETHPAERELRSQGIPLAGDSMIFPVPDDQIACDPFKIPDDWYEILAVDFGGDHPFAVIKYAFDPNGKKKTAYIVDAQKHRRMTISQEASIIKGMGGDKIPVAWPHDGNKQDKQSGKPIADLYRDEGVEMLDRCFSNPPEPFKEEGSGGQGIDAGLKKMYWAMTEGRFKVFRNLTDWFKEKGSYHKKDGQAVAINDDLMSASRYGYMSALDSNDDFRFAECIKKKTDFFKPIKPDYRGIV